MAKTARRQREGIASEPQRRTYRFGEQVERLMYVLAGERRHLYKEQACVRTHESGRKAGTACAPFSFAHRLASSHGTSRSSSRSTLQPTRTTTRSGLASARASASHGVRLSNVDRLLWTQSHAHVHTEATHLVTS
jgi:hypothetical protein